MKVPEMFETHWAVEWVNTLGRRDRITNESRQYVLKAARRLRNIGHSVTIVPIAKPLV